MAASSKSKFDFFIEEEVRFQVSKSFPPVMGTGRTITMGSSRVSFTSHEILREDDFIELAVDWPVLLNGNVRLQLCFSGKVLRSTKRVTVVCVRSYEFRTRAIAVVLETQCVSASA